MKIEKSHHYYLIEKAIHFLNNNVELQPNLDELAQHVNLSPFHFQRIFTQWAGVSPKQFLSFITVQHAKLKLKKPAATLFNTAFEQGLSSTSRLHDHFVKIIGMSPGEFKSEGAFIQLNYQYEESLFGKYIIFSSARGIVHLSFLNDFKDDFWYIKKHFPQASLVEKKDEFQKRVQSFFLKQSSFNSQIPLHIKGTAFQLNIWQALLNIPEASLTTYGQLAKAIQKPTAARAIGTGIGANPIAYLIPCHRVIKNTGLLGEYRWGADRKKVMIGWESAKFQTGK